MLRSAGSEYRALFKRNKRTWEGTLVHYLVFVCAILSILTTVAILLSLVIQSWGFFSQIPVWEFLGEARWSPILKPRSYGVLPLVGERCS